MRYIRHTCVTKVPTQWWLGTIGKATEVTSMDYVFAAKGWFTIPPRQWNAAAHIKNDAAAHYITCTQCILPDIVDMDEEDKLGELDQWTTISFILY